MTLLPSILDTEEPRKFYNPEVCPREVNFVEGTDVDAVNRALRSMEHVLASTTLSKCEIRIIICLSIYRGLTHQDLQNLTGMKQSAVSRSITRLTKKKLVYSRIGKKYEVGRPYQLVVLNFAVDELIDLINNQIHTYRYDMDYLLSSLKRVDELEGGT